MSDLIGMFIGIGFAVLLLVVCVFGLISSIRTSKNKKKIRKENKQKGLILAGFSNHIMGLPIAENVFTTINLWKDKVEFIANGVTFDLDLKRITDIGIKTDVEIQKQYVSSVGGAVGGAVLLGHLGAMIGGRAKQKKVKEVTQYLIFTYLKDEKVDYICFELNSANLSSAYKFVNYYLKNKDQFNTNEQRIAI